MIKLLNRDVDQPSQLNLTYSNLINSIQLSLTNQPKTKSPAFSPGFFVLSHRIVKLNVKYKTIGLIDGFLTYNYAIIDLL